MSHEELQRKVEDIEKKQFKSTYIKAGSILLSACILSATIGINLNDWTSWRKTTTDRVDKLETWKETTMRASNERRTAEINNIKIK